MGVGFTFAILCLGVVREALGSGTILGVSVFGPNFEPWVVMVLPGGAYFVLGALLLLFNWIDQRRRARSQAPVEPESTTAQTAAP